MDFTEWKGVSVLSNWKNIQKAKAIESKNRERILAVNPHVDDGSGIYFLTRTGEDGIRYAYIGQAKHLLTRLAQHLSGYQHIDLSIKSHGLLSVDENIYGWNIGFFHYEVDDLDYWEKYWIKKYAQYGYQLRNKTAGGQGEGKKQIAEYRPGKGYRDGLAQGKINLARELANIADKHLVISLKPEKQNNSVSQKQYQKFMELLHGEKDGESNE
jgi:hypothetical protein